MNKWFNLREQETMIAHGLILKEYEVNKRNVIIGKAQCLFIKPEAEEARIERQTIEADHDRVLNKGV